MLEPNLRFVGKIIKVENDKNYPKGYKYRFQILHFKNNEWKRLVRIDNSLYFGKPEQHIHIGNKVKKINIKLEDIREYLTNLAKELIKGDKNENKSNK